MIDFAASKMPFDEVWDKIDEFLQDNYPEVSILTTVCGGVPCAKPHSNPINNGIMLVSYLFFGLSLIQKVLIFLLFSQE